ncbi:hypothetical protein CBL_07224 [Carabus blaptoides fortunei]
MLTIKPNHLGQTEDHMLAAASSGSTVDNFELMFVVNIDFSHMLLMSTAIRNEAKLQGRRRSLAILLSATIFCDNVKIPRTRIYYYSPSYNWDNRSTEKRIFGLGDRRK